MSYFNVNERMIRDHIHELLREANRERLVHEALTDSDRNNGALSRVMTWLGNRLAGLGQWPQPRTASKGVRQTLPAPR